MDGKGQTALMERLDRMLAFDPETGQLRAEAGVTLREILETFVPRGWFLPVTPGTKAVTLGGAVAFDVHGKNHPRDGGISSFVRRLSLLLASGEEVTCSPDENADLFWATVSGAGLTGIITEVTLELRPIETAYLATRQIKARDLGEAFALFEEYGPKYRYAAAWLDGMATGDALGRGLCWFGSHAALTDLDARQRQAPLDYAPSHRFEVPASLPDGLLTDGTVQAFNWLYYARQRNREQQGIEDLESFFYPLDAVGRWNRLYGTDGFVQYQCVLPTEESYAGVTALLQELHDADRRPYLAVLKRMGPEDGGFLSFPMRGYTLSVDLPRGDGLDEVLQVLDAIVRRRGGRVYLAKDAALSPETFRAMYPRYEDWLEVKRQVDPTNRFSSALARRLEMGSRDTETVMREA